MGAEGSKGVVSKPSAQYANLPPAQAKAMKRAEISRGRRLSMKDKTKTEFLGDVTAYPEKEYSQAELQNIEKFLSKRLTVMEKQIESLKANKYQGFIKVYTGIKDGNDQSAIASQMPQHKHLNRYNNIVAYDASRVKVAAGEHTNNTDYINANHVHGHGRANMYIASQGPVPDAQPAFWEMIWANNTQLIVMVTGEVEGGKLKCHRYWPDDTEHAVTFGSYAIEMTEIEAHPTYIARCFKVNKGSESKFVFHYQYTAWPDHGVPDTAIEMLKFRAVVKDKLDPKAGPMVVHCSAGVGRTGTFIGLDRYLDSCADLDDSMNVLDIVKDMRMARNFMVQAQAQFIYLYEACTEGLSKLLDKVRRELRFADFTPQEQEQLMLTEIETDMAAEAQTFKRRLSMDVPIGVRIEATHRHDDGSHYTDDLASASKMRPDQRLKSLASSTDQWLKRGNVPMDAAQHGYSSPQSLGLETRLTALSESRTKWMKAYSEAEKSWQSSQDAEGVYYDVGHQLTSIESRVMSLANAEAAWTIVGNGQNNLYEEMAAENLANLELRLQSLSYTVVTAEQRWKDRGNGFRGPTDKADAAAALQASNASYAGGLTERLVSLQTGQTAWKQRYNGGFDKKKFFDELTAEDNRQEEISRKRAEEQAAIDAALAKETKASLKISSEQAKKQATQEAEAVRRSKARSVAESASKANQGEYLPHAAQMAKANSAKAKEAAKAQKEAAKLAAAEEKKEKKERKEAEQSMAKAKASKFLKKMSGGQ